MRTEKPKDLPLGGQLAEKIRHTHRRPAEWIITLSDGRKCYILAGAKKLTICTAPTLNEALRSKMLGGGESIPHLCFNSEVSTGTMLSLTGLSLKDGVSVNQVVPGDLL